MGDQSCPKPPTYLQRFGRGWGPLQLQSKHANLECQVVVLQPLTQHRQQEGRFGQGIRRNPRLLAGGYLIFLSLWKEGFYTPALLKSYPIPTNEGNYITCYHFVNKLCLTFSDYHHFHLH